MNRINDLAIWCLIGFALIALVLLLGWLDVGCAPDAEPGPTIGSVFKLEGC